MTLDVRKALEQIAELVDAVDQTLLGKRVDLEARDRRSVERESLRGQVRPQARARVRASRLDDARVSSRVDGHGQEAVLHRVLLEDVCEGTRDDDAQPPPDERPRSVLARGPAPEVGAGDEHTGADRVGPVERKVGVRRAVRAPPPVAEQAVAESALVGDLEESRRDDLVGVDVVGGEHDVRRFDGRELVLLLGLHAAPPRSERGSTTRPLTAAAAAVTGDASSVLPPRPCRPSKLRLLVLTAYWPGLSWSPFMAMHIEHPASRHSVTAARNTASSPSASA